LSLTSIRKIKRIRSFSDYLEISIFTQTLHCLLSFLVQTSIGFQRFHTSEFQRDKFTT